MKIVIDTDDKFADIALWGAVNALVSAGEMLRGLGEDKDADTCRIASDYFALGAMESKQLWTKQSQGKSREIIGQLKLV